MLKKHNLTKILVILLLTLMLATALMAVVAPGGLAVLYHNGAAQGNSLFTGGTSILGDCVVQGTCPIGT